MDEFENMSEFSPFTWHPVYSDSNGEMSEFNASIEQQSLSTSRGILETIVEETSDDEDNNLNGKWSPDDSFSSGSSETGSVVRVEVVPDLDNDTISERDFICPPKRRRQETEQRLELLSALCNPASVTLTASLEEKNPLFDNYFMKTNDLRYRFDELGDLFADADRLSFTSLSRSSSLVQFESLERQMQGDSQISGSSPSIYSQLSYDSNTNTSINNNQLPLDKFEKLEEKPIPTPTIKIPSIKISNNTVQYNNSDSEPFSSSSSGSSSYSSDESETNNEIKKSKIAAIDSSLSSTASSGSKQSSNCYMTKCIENRKKSLSLKSKNSVDSLSEDSGYCDHVARHPSIYPDTSITTGNMINVLEDEDGSAIEEKSILRNEHRYEEMESLLLANLSERQFEENDYMEEDDISYHSMENLNRQSSWRRKKGDRDSDLLANMNIDSSVGVCLNKSRSSGTSKKPMLNNGGNKQCNKITTNCLKIETTTITATPCAVTRQTNDVKNTPHNKPKIISTSSPDLFCFSGSSSLADEPQLQNQKNHKNNSAQRLKRSYNHRTRVADHKDFYVSSVPDYINLLGGSAKSAGEENEERFDAFEWNPSNAVTNSIASKDFNLYELNFNNPTGHQSAPAIKQKVVDITASCANLTLLCYSSDEDYESDRLSAASNRKSAPNFLTMEAKSMSSLSSDSDDGEHYAANNTTAELSSLLEEISAHFNRNLSILNDRDEHYDPKYEFFEPEEKKIEPKQRKFVMQQPPPQPPPRRSQIKTSPNCIPPKFSFDRDPTNLSTTYAESMEKCNFNVDEPINVYSSRSNLYTMQLERLKDGSSEQLHTSTPIKKRNFVSSAPNLNYFEMEVCHNPSGHSNMNHSSNQNLHSLNIFTDENSRCTSMKEIPTCNKSRTSSRTGSGILTLHSNSGSKTGSGMIKGVSFCPIVSEISWRDTVDDEEDFEDGPLNNEHFRNDSMVNYYHEEFSDDENENDVVSQASDMQHVTVEINDDQSTAAPLTESSAQQSDTSNTSNTSNTSVSSQDCIVIVDELKESERDNATIIDSVWSSNNFSATTSKMYTEEKTQNFLAAEVAAQQCEANNNNQSVKSANGAQKSVSIVDGKSDTMSVDSGSNSGTKIKATKPDKKQKTFFSRISSGFRFSFRNKSKKQKNNGVTTYNNVVDRKKSDNKQQQVQNDLQKLPSDKCNQDFIFIPLKDPNDNNDQVDNYGQQPAEEIRAYNQQQNVKNHVLIGKPPLPSKAPRIVGAKAKNNNRTSAPAHAPQRAASTPRDQYREIDDDDYHNKFGSPTSNLKQYYSKMGSQNRLGLIETNLDTDETIVNGKAQSLLELGIGLKHLNHQTNNKGQLIHRMAGMGGVQVLNQNSGYQNGEPNRPHKSMEFLLDKENHRTVVVPENELQKARESNATLSEHQLRVQASLQKLNVPDWYKQYSGNTSVNTSYYKSGGDVGGLLRKRNSDIGRWTGLSSKTTSLSSLGSNKSEKYSPVMLSPSAHSHCAGQTGFSRWSTSHLNSSQTSPSVSTRSSFVRNTNVNSSILSGHSGHSATIGGYASSNTNSGTRGSYRQPYLGWRSQEKLSQPRTPSERLASTLLTQKQQEEEKHRQHQIDQPIATQEIQSSIKEVTSAIVHYVNDQTNRGSRSRSVSPSQRCWLESSFVGTKPLESPQTPIIDHSFAQQHHKINIGPMSANATNYDSIRLNGSVVRQPVSSPLPYLERRTSDMEDVLSSLLGLPLISNSNHTSSEDIANQAIFPVNAKASSSLTVEESMQLRRHSEGDASRRQAQPQQIQKIITTVTAPEPSTLAHQRRVSLDSFEVARGELLKCRYPKCDNAATPLEAKKQYKSCHNCTYLYCSRDCRRLHWEKHRRFCLHSRVSAICRHVLSTCKDDPDTLKHLSLLARRGYMSHGRGVVRLLFRSPENAGIFIKSGFQCLGEVSYVRWPDLLPTEMGPELYSELLRLSNEYKTDTKMLIYVAICVVSEAPSGAANAPVKWERQLVSRCAKLKLSKNILSDKSLFSSQLNTTIIQQDFNTDVLILTFNSSNKFTQKSREIILTNVLYTLQNKGISLRKHYPEVYQRLNSYVEGLTDRFLPVTIHPRDNSTGRSFVCIIMPISGDSERIKTKQEGSERVQTIDVGLENLDPTPFVGDYTRNEDIFTEGTQF